jgi:uncharacterized protein YndB with AHSA1/START domain
MMSEGAAVAAVTGTARAFGATASTTRPDRVWRLWTQPASWGDWDRGLTSSSLDGPFGPGARGRLVDTSGRTSRFVVEEVETGRHVRVRVRLPAASLVLDRSVLTSSGGDETLVRHDVRFEGPLGPVFAVLLGRRFRRLLPPTLEALVQAAQAPLP